VKGANAPHPEAGCVSSYVIGGVPCVLTASAELIGHLDGTYGAFRAELPPGEEILELELAEGEPLVDLFNRLVEGVVERLSRRGIYAIHAASLVHAGRALIVSGRSGSGKTTIALGLVQHGLRILSDEFALSAPDARTILPYRRGLHIKPGTPELIAELGFLEGRARLPLGGGSEWALLPCELERVFPGCLGEAAPLRHVVLLETRSDEPARLDPIPAALAAVELLAATPAAAGDFAGVLGRMTRLLDGTRCARLHPGLLADSLGLLLDWLASDDGRD
jgi:hypothetical protein